MRVEVVARTKESVARYRKLDAMKKEDQQKTTPAATPVVASQPADPAFLRRIPYKLEIGGPSREAFRHIFDKVSASNGLDLSDEVFDYFVGELTVKRGMELANFQPKFLIDQIVAACNFKEMAPRYERQFIDYAISNLSVHRTKGQPMTLAKVS